MLNELIIFSLIFAASAATPGPDTMTIFGRALSGGRLSAVPFTLGVILAKLSLLTLVVLGLAALAQTFGQVFVFLKLAGAAYLVWIGVRLWRKSGEPEAHELGKAVTWRDGVTGYVLGISNPQAVAFYVALLPTVVDVQVLSFGTYVSLCAVLACTMVAIAAVYTLLAERLRGLFRSVRGRRAVNRVAGGVMVASGVVVATR